MTPKTPKELEDLLHSQVVLTFQNHGKAYKFLQGSIKSFDYGTFRKQLINTATLTSLTRPLDISLGLTPQRRCVVMLWDYYMQDIPDWKSRGTGVEKYNADKAEIAAQNKLFISDVKPTVEILYNPSLDPGPGKVRIKHLEAKELGDKAEFFISREGRWQPCHSCAFQSDYAYRTDAPATSAVDLHDPDRPAPAGYIRIDHEQAEKLADVAEYYGVMSNAWLRTTKFHGFMSGLAYCAPVEAVLTAFPNHLVNQPETLKEITMSQVNCSFDSSVPVATVTLIYGQPVSSYSESDLLAAVRKLDGIIETLSKVSGSERIAKSVEAAKAEREAIIKAFDAAA